MNAENEVTVFDLPEGDGDFFDSRHDGGRR